MDPDPDYDYKTLQTCVKFSEMGFDGRLNSDLLEFSFGPLDLESGLLALDSSMKSDKSICSNVRGHSSFVFPVCKVLLLLLLLTTCFVDEAEASAPAHGDLSMPQQPGDSLLPLVVAPNNSDLTMLVKQKRLERRQANKDGVQSKQALQLALQSAHPHSLSPAVEPLLAHHMIQYSDWSLDSGSDVQNSSIAIRPSLHEDSVPISQCIPGSRTAAALDLAAVSMAAAWKDFWLAIGNGVSTHSIINIQNHTPLTFTHDSRLKTLWPHKLVQLGCLIEESEVM